LEKVARLGKKEEERPMTEEIIDQYDEPWKEGLEEYLKEFLELLFPEVHAGIDWSVEPQSRDKEFQQLIAASARGKQIADKLWEVQRKVRRLFRLVDWFMRLPEPLAIEFRENLERFEGDQKMPYVTSVEQLAKAEGKAEGKAETILLFLEARFGAISEKLSSTIRGITDSDRLTELARLSAVATTIEEFEVAVLSL
jgi:hypothetical protein